jgi:hypothetical protein
MHDPFNACPVSGEIMTDAAAAPPGRRGIARGGRRDIVEAEFETIRPDAPPHGLHNRPARAAERIERPQKRTELRGNEKMRHLREWKKGGEAPGGGWSTFAFWMAGAALVTMAFLFSGGSALIGGTSLTLPSGAGLNDNFHTAGIPGRTAGSKAHGRSPAVHFLGTSGDRAQAQGSFVFSDQLEPPKDKGKSASISFSEEE